MRSAKPGNHLKDEMSSFHSKYFVYWELKTAPQKVSFCFKCPDTGTVRMLGNILYSTTNCPWKCVSAENFNKNNKNSDICLSMLTAFKTNRCSAADSLRASKNNEEQAHLIDQVFFLAFWSTSFKVMNTLFIFNRFHVHEMAIFIQSTAPLRAHFIEFKV